MKNEIQIKQDTTIRQLQLTFNKLYPFLKLEFFKEPHKAGKGTARNKMIESNAKLSQIQALKSFGKITLSADITVREMESIFHQKFGLYVQVFRKSGNIWLETSATDNWTLVQQNEEGESLAKHWKLERENSDDHDIY